MKTKSIRARHGIVVGLLLLTTLIAALPVGAEEYVREGFEGAGGTEAVSGKEGTGFSHEAVGAVAQNPQYVDLQVSLDGAGAGAISFDLQRLAGEVPYGRQTVFALQGRGGGNHLLFQVKWEGDRNGGRPVFLLSGWAIHMQGIGLWNARIPVDRTVSPDQWIHVDLTWDDTSEVYNLFVDGRPMDTSPTHWDDAVDRFVPGDVRIAVNEEARSNGLPPIFSAHPFEELLARVARIRLGVNYEEGDSVGHSPLQKGVLDNFAVYVNEDHMAGGGGLSIASLDHDAARIAGFSDTLVAGDSVTVTMKGAPGAEASFDVVSLANARGEIALSWKGWGVYLEEITFFDDDQVNLEDVEEYRVFASGEPIDIAAITAETPFVEALEVEEQSFVLAEVTVPQGEGEYAVESMEPDRPYYVAVMAVMDGGSFAPVVLPTQRIPMMELENDPGAYEGTFSVNYRERTPEAVVVGRLTRGEASISAVDDEVFDIDARLNIVVVSSADELKADEESTSKIKVSVTNANGDPISGHEVRFVLATTSQYTGVVGGGSFTNEVGGSLSRDFRGETDLFGQATATYTAGFAAKTAIVVARDMVSNDVGAGYVRTYIEANAELELEAVQEVAGKALGYTITVTSSDEWLTADGESEARITALVAQNGIPVEGHRVGFNVTSGTGKIRVVDRETGSDGKARAVYTAGKKIGIVLITAVDHTVGISGSVQIELRSDAPAKIAITLTPDLLPADGRSTADIEVVVTDINDNPNEGIEVEYEVEIGSGRLRNIDEVTGRKGESAAEYVAGRMPGKVSIKVTVRSTLPTEEEMAEARALATAVTDYDFF